MMKIAVLCTLPPEKSNYRHIEDVELYDKEKDCRSFNDSRPVITHAPCAQWSRLRSFAKSDKELKDLAYFCWEKVQLNGGIFEHPCGSYFFKHIGADITKLITLDQVRFGHIARKRTWLYFHNCNPLPLPIGTYPRTNKITSASKLAREQTPIRFAKWLVHCIRWHSVTT